MKDLKNYANEDMSGFENISQKFEEVTEDKLEGLNADYKNIVNDFVGRYGGMSENEMMKELIKLVAQKKSDGTFDINQIRLAAEKIAPLFNEKQREKMMKMLDMLK